MAGAGVLERQTHTFDWALAEAQCADVPDGMLAPEDEVYGRSSSAARRLGALIMSGEVTMEAAVESPEAEQAKAEFITSVREGLGTDKERAHVLEVREFRLRPVIGGRVMAEDGKTAMTDVTRNGVICAEEEASRDPRFAPQLTRSILDHQNALEVDRMAKGETGYNVRIVVSLFPEEAAAKSGDAYWRHKGYVPLCKRGFVQLYCMSGSGMLQGSLSFSGSDKQKAWGVFKQIGIEIPEDEISDHCLKYAITDNLSVAQAKKLAVAIADMIGDARDEETVNTVDITEQHDPIMQRAFAESYAHICASLASGYQTREVRALVLKYANVAHHFNERYAKALYGMRASDRFTGEDWATMHDLLVYSTIEMMRALYLQDPNTVLASSLLLQSVGAAEFQGMLGGFGADGAIHNRGYSACGLAIDPGGDKANSDGSPQSAYGGRDKKDNSDEGEGDHSIGFCRTSGCPSLPGMTEVGGCNVCLRYCQPLWNAGINPEDIFKRFKSSGPGREKSRGVQYVGTSRSRENVKDKSGYKMQVLKGIGRAASKE